MNDATIPIKRLLAGLALAALCAAAPAPASTGAPSPAHAVKAAKKKKHSRRHRPQSACQKLRGHDWAPSSSLKLVERRSSAIETDLGACELPRGQVRYFAIRVQADTVTSDFTVHSVAGRWALLSTQSSSQYGADSRVWVVDIAGGRILYEISNWTCTISDTPCSPEPPKVVKGFVNRIGKSVLAFSDGASTSIVGFGTDGHRRTLDSGSSDEIPASTLKLGTNVANWLHSGEQRGGVLP
jgi:hypothetical protein